MTGKSLRVGVLISTIAKPRFKSRDNSGILKVVREKGFLLCLVVDFQGDILV